MSVSVAKESHKTIGVPSAVHEKSDTFSEIVDAVNCGVADAFRIIHRLEVSAVEDESVGESASVHIGSNDVAMIVQAQCLREGGQRKIKSCQLPVGDQKAVIDPSAIDVEAWDRSSVIDTGGLGTAGGSR